MQKFIYRVESLEQQIIFILFDNDESKLRAVLKETGEALNTLMQ